jgi:hypothetical protein
MSSVVLNVTFDCRDAGAVVRIWEVVTWTSQGARASTGNDYWGGEPPDGSLPRLLFVTVPERKSIKSRVHLDLLPNDSGQEEEIARLLDLGATVVDDPSPFQPRGLDRYGGPRMQRVLRRGPSHLKPVGSVQPHGGPGDGAGSSSVRRQGNHLLGVAVSELV